MDDFLQEEKRDEAFEEEDEDRVVRRMVVTEDDTGDEVEEEKESRRKQVEEEDIIEVETRKEEEENEEAEEMEVNKMLIEEGVVSGEEEELEEREMKRRRVEEVCKCSEVRANTTASSFTAIEFKPESSSLNKNDGALKSNNGGSSSEDGLMSRRIETGIFSNVPPELFRHIFKFLSSEVHIFIYNHQKTLLCIFLIVINCEACSLMEMLQDLISCSLVCRFLNYAASDESLWRRL